MCGEPQANRAKSDACLCALRPRGELTQASRFMLNRSNIETSFTDGNQQMKAARAGMWAAFRCPHSEADERMQPFALDLIMIAWTKYLDIKNCAQDYVMLIAMLLA